MLRSASLPLTLSLFLLILPIGSARRATPRECVADPSYCPAEYTLVSPARCPIRVRVGLRRVCTVRTGCVFVPRYRFVDGYRCLLGPVVGAVPRPFQQSTEAPPIAPAATVGASSGLPILPGAIPVLPPAIPVLPPPVPVVLSAPGVRGGCPSECAASFSLVNARCGRADCKVVVCSAPADAPSASIGYSCVSTTTPGASVLLGDGTFVQTVATDAPVVSNAASTTSTSTTTTTSTTASASTLTSTASVTVAATQSNPTIATDPPVATVGTVATQATVGTEATIVTALATEPAPIVTAQVIGVPDSPPGSVQGLPNTGSGPVSGTIYYAADDSATLFVNGVQRGTPTTRWEDTESYTTILLDGTVIAVEAQDNGAIFGAIAAVQTASGGWPYATGAAGAPGAQWRAIRAADYKGEQDAWKTASFDACGWAQPVVRPNAGSNNPGRSLEFPRAESNAVYVWPESGVVNDLVYMRLQLGRSCPDASTPGVSQIVFAGDNQVDFYLNGGFRSATRDWMISREDFVSLNDGDVLAFEATDLGAWFGMAVSVLTDGSYTGTSDTPIGDEWRAVKADEYKGPADAWRTNAHDACGWAKPRILPGSTDTSIPGKALDYPTGTGSVYVWAEGTGAGEAIYVRRVFGTDCDDENTPGISAVSYAGDNKVDFYIDGVFRGVTLDWMNTRTDYVTLTQGNVLAFEATDAGAWYGMIASVDTDGTFTGTSDTAIGDQWRAVKADKYKGPADAWRTDAYDACGWAKPLILPDPEITTTPGKAQDFPTGTGSVYVWAEGAGVNDVIYVRRVYDTDCDDENSAGMSTVVYAGDNEVNFFLNGVFRGVTLEWRNKRTDYVTINTGDVLAFEVSDFGAWYGMIAAYQLAGSTTWEATGAAPAASTPWRAIRADDYTGGDEWKTDNSNPCQWTAPDVLPQDTANPTPGMSPDFPYASSSGQYVWANGGGVQDTIYVRVVVGATCP